LQDDRDQRGAKGAADPGRASAFASRQSLARRP
jgi:hypothetical protein